jgi:hypothetical protein
LHRIPAFIFILFLSFVVFLIIVVIYLFPSFFSPIFHNFITLLALLISLSLSLLLSLGTSFLICIYFSHFLFAPFAATFTFLSHELTLFSASKLLYSVLDVSLYHSFSHSDHSDHIAESVNGQKSWLFFNPKLSVW